MSTSPTPPLKAPPAAAVFVTQLHSAQRQYGPGYIGSQVLSTNEYADHDAKAEVMRFAEHDFALLSLGMVGFGSAKIALKPHSLRALADFLCAAAADIEAFPASRLRHNILLGTNLEHGATPANPALAEAA